LPERRPVHVVAGLIIDPQRRVLVQQRTSPPHFAGLWEFPGGKIESEESAAAALDRELGEELGLRSVQSTPWMRLLHDYSIHPKRPDQPTRLPRILLDIRLVTTWQGDPDAREGQHCEWVEISRLLKLDFLDANRPIIEALIRGESSVDQIVDVDRDNVE